MGDKGWYTVRESRWKSTIKDMLDGMFVKQNEVPVPQHYKKCIPYQKSNGSEDGDRVADTIACQKCVGLYTGTQYDYHCWDLNYQETCKERKSLPTSRGMDNAAE